MKKIRGLTNPPALLAQYLSGNPSVSQPGGPSGTLRWRAFRNHLDGAAYRDLLQELVKEQGGLCCYCETRLTDDAGQLRPHAYQIEHIEPKSSSPQRTLDCTNLALCCDGGQTPSQGRAAWSCGHKKDNSPLPIGTDPRGLPSVPSVFNVGINGILSADGAACGMAATPAISDANGAIAVLNLNAERLRKARQDRGDSLRAQLSPLWALLQDSDPVRVQLAIRALQTLVAGQLSRDSYSQFNGFWTTARSVFEPLGTKYLTTNPAGF